jgi:opacity protein-like surface antigen
MTQRRSFRARALRLRAYRQAAAALVLVLAATLASPAAAQTGAEGADVAAWTSTGAAAGARPPGDWLVEWTPYFWAAGLKGDVGIRGRSTHIALSFGDLIKDLDGAFYLPVEMRKGRWGTGIELMLVRISDKSGTPGRVFDDVSVSSHQTMVELTLRYRPVGGPKPLTLDLLAGARAWGLSDQILFTADGGPDLLVEAGENWVDPIVGARMIVPIRSRWSVQARGDIGGFGAGSDFTWQVIGGVSYRLNDWVTFRGGYRHLSVDFDSGGTGFLYDVGMGGAIIGVSVRP